MTIVIFILIFILSISERIFRKTFYKYVIGCRRAQFIRRAIAFERMWEPLIPYNSLANVVHLLAERSDIKSNVKLGGFRSQLQASNVSSHTEKLGFNETLYLWMPIYIYLCVCVCEGTQGVLVILWNPVIPPTYSRKPVPSTEGVETLARKRNNTFWMIDRDFCWVQGLLGLSFFEGFLFSMYLRETLI